MIARFIGGPLDRRTKTVPDETVVYYRAAPEPPTPYPDYQLGDSAGVAVADETPKPERYHLAGQNGGPLAGLGVFVHSSCTDNNIAHTLVGYYFN